MQEVIQLLNEPGRKWVGAALFGNLKALRMKMKITRFIEIQDHFKDQNGIPIYL